MPDCQRDSHATSRTAIYANITQTGRIRVYCCWFWVVLVGFVGGFGWFWVVQCYSVTTLGLHTLLRPATPKIFFLCGFQVSKS